MIIFNFLGFTQLVLVAVIKEESVGFKVILMTLQWVFELRNKWSFFVNGYEDCTMVKFVLNKNEMDYKLGWYESWILRMVFIEKIKCFKSFEEFSTQEWI